MTRPINLKRGDFAAVINIKDDEPEDDEPMFGLWGPQRRPEKNYNGKPFKVVAVCLPFVCVTDGTTKIGLDTRRVTLQKVSREFAVAMDTPAIPEARRTQSVFIGRKPKPEKPGPRDCPRCGNRMRERLQVPGKSEWALVCKNCESERPAPKLVVQ